MSMAPAIASDQKKKRHCLFGCLCFFVSLFVRVFICLVACLLVRLILFPFVSFLVSLLFDDRCSKILTNILTKIGKRKNNSVLLRVLEISFFGCLKPNSFRMSLPKVIMNANTFTMTILCVPLKPNTFRVSFPEIIMIANVFTSQKHQIPKKNYKQKLWRLKQN